MGTLEVSLSQRWLEPRLIFNLLTKEQYMFRDIRYEKYFELLWMANFRKARRR